MKNNLLSFLLSFLYFLIAALLLYTATFKIRSFERFIFDMNNQPFPDSWTPFLVRAILAIEIAIPISFIFKRTRIAGLYGFTALMTIYTIYAALILLHVFKYVPCSCGGFLSHMKWPKHLAFTLFCVFIGLIAIRLTKRSASNEFQAKAITW
jgi:putative oxidoreductase